LIASIIPLQGREIILDGQVEGLTHEENERYWNELPRERQLRFRVYSPTSNQLISKGELDLKYQKLFQEFKNKPIQMSDN